MLAMTSFIADYTFKNEFLIFYTLQTGLPNVAGPGVTYPFTLPLDRPGCVNNALINALKKTNAVR